MLLRDREKVGIESSVESTLEGCMLCSELVNTLTVCREEGKLCFTRGELFLCCVGGFDGDPEDSSSGGESNSSLPLALARANTSGDTWGRGGG